MTKAVLGIIGGSGFYNLPGLENPRWETVASPWGEPSDQILFAEIAGPGGRLPVRFLPRHGRGHRLSPSGIDYRANIDAMKRAGVFAFVCLTWVLFRSASMAGAMAHFRALLNVGDLLSSAIPLGQIVAMLMAALVCFFAPNSQQIALWLVARRVQNAMLLEHVALTAIIVLLSAAFITPDKVNAFIYFEF